MFNLRHSSFLCCCLLNGSHIQISHILSLQMHSLVQSLLQQYTGIIVPWQCYSERHPILNRIRLHFIIMCIFHQKGWYHLDLHIKVYHQNKKQVEEEGFFLHETSSSFVCCIIYREVLLIKCLQSCFKSGALIITVRVSRLKTISQLDIMSPRWSVQPRCFVMKCLKPFLLPVFCSAKNNAWR